MMSIIFFFFFFFILTSSSLPLIIIFMIFFSSLSFTFMWFCSGSCWFPLIFSLLFIGGILVIFMVISSLFPNVKNFNSTVSTKFLALISLFSLTFYFPMVGFFTPLYIKILSMSGGNFYTFIFLIVSYFFCFLYFVSKDKISLRSFI